MPWLRVVAAAGSGGDSFGVAPRCTADLWSCLPTHGCWRWCSYPDSTDTALTPRCSGTADAFVLSAPNRRGPWHCPDHSGGCKPLHRYRSRGVSRAGSKHRHCQASIGFLAARNIRVNIYRIALDNMKSESWGRTGPEPSKWSGGRSLVHRRRSLEAEGGAWTSLFNMGLRGGAYPWGGAIGPRPRGAIRRCRTGRVPPRPPPVPDTAPGSQRQFLLRHSHGGADGESLPAGQGGGGPRDPPLLPAAARPLPGHPRPRRRALPGAAAGRAAARLPYALQG